MRGLFGPVSAEHVFGFILCCAVNLHLYLRQQMEATWAPIGGESARSSFTAGPGVVSTMDRAHLQLSDCTLGIVGLGAIGREIAERAEAFKMHVVAVDPCPTTTPPGVDEVWNLGRLDELLALSDFVVIAAPHTPSTVGMFGREQFQQMKTTGYLINIGRGAIVKLDHLVDSLVAGEIAGAALDVFEVEPLPAGHPLWAMKNVMITPHVAACSVQIAPAHLSVLLENIRRFVNGEELLNQASKVEWF
jgi:phosphoglycerate dehydrogenase-like enzyme